VERAVPVVSGIPGVGKTTVATLVAHRLPRSAHVEAEALMRFVVGGAVQSGAEPEEEAMRQLLRRAWTEGRVS
jgi:adenylate kinase